MAIISLFFVAIYLLFAGWQLNDPDPVLWATLYLIPAYVSFRAWQKKFNRELLAALCVIYAAFAINTYLQMSAYEGFFTEGAGLNMKTSNQEFIREAGGLAICVLSFLVYFFYAGARPETAKVEQSV